VKFQDHGLLVHLPSGQSLQMLWELAVAAGEQIRHLRPQRSTLEEVFLKAIEHNDV
jgi:ABC-2 type transport system ATP-binding protein